MMCAEAKAATIAGSSQLQCTIKELALSYIYETEFHGRIPSRQRKKSTDYAEYTDSFLEALGNTARLAGDR